MKNLSYLVKFGFYLSMLFLAVGMFENNSRFDFLNFSRIGMSILLYLPLFFVFVLALIFAFKKEFKKSLIAFVLLVVLLSNIFL